MPRQRHILIVFLILVGLAAGCQRSVPASANSQTASSVHQANARAYYYFITAQLKLKQGDINEALWHLKQALEHDDDSSYLKLEMANLLMIKKEDQKSLDLIGQVLAEDPDNSQALEMSGRIYQQQNQLDKAVEAYEKVLSLRPTDQGIYLVLGPIYWNKKKYSDAERVFENMTINIPDSYAAFYFYGKALAAQGKLEKAEKALLKSIDLNASLEEPRFELVKIYQSLNQSQRLTEMYRAILKYNPENHKAVFGLAEHYRKLDQKQQAHELLSGMGRRVEVDNRIVATLFERYLETKRYGDAIWVLKSMLKAAPGNSDLHFIAGIAFSGLEQEEQALNHMLKVTPQSRFYAKAVVHSALILHDAGRIDRAIEVVRTALVHQPDNMDYYLYLGSFYEELERFEEALQVLAKGLAKDAKHDRLHFRMGVVYDKMGRKDKSIAAMKNVLQLTPNDAEALNYLGYTYADMGINLDEAEVLIQTALKIKPNDGYITDSLGWVHYKRGNYNQALELLNKAVSLIPDDPVILEHLGDVYLKMNLQDKALEYYRQSLNKKTTNRGGLENKIRALNQTLEQ